MRIKPATGKPERWELVGAPAGTRLLQVIITFPEIESVDKSGGTIYHVGGPANVTIRIRDSNGTEKDVSSVRIDW
jgi:hypothetical protein